MNRSLALVALAALLFSPTAASASVLSFLNDEQPDCVVSVLKVHGKTATVCYRGERGQQEASRNCSEMKLDQIPQAARMLGCALNS